MENIESVSLRRCEHALLLMPLKLVLLDDGSADVDDVGTTGSEGVRASMMLSGERDGEMGPVSAGGNGNNSEAVV